MLLLLLLLLLLLMLLLGLLVVLRRRVLGWLLLLLVLRAAGAGLLVLLGWLRVGRGTRVSTRWLLHGGGRASFPLADPLLDRGLVGWGFLLRRGVGRGWGRTEVREVLVRPIGLTGVEPSRRAGFAGFADARGLAPPAGTWAEEEGGGDQEGGEEEQG